MPHTPGPWFPVEYSGYWDIQIKEEYSADDNLLDQDNCPEAEANAKLMAAAPDMFEALKAIHDWTDERKIFGPLFSKVAAALQKATE